MSKSFRRSSNYHSGDRDSKKMRRANNEAIRRYEEDEDVDFPDEVDIYGKTDKPKYVPNNAPKKVFKRVDKWNEIE